MQIRRSAVVYVSQDSMILSSRVNCTGTHLRGRTLLIRKLGIVRRIRPAELPNQKLKTFGFASTLLRARRAL